MTISSTHNRKDYTASGSDTFAYDFLIFDETHLFVYLNSVLQTLTTHYTVTGVGDAGGGNVIFVATPSNGDIVSIVRVVPMKQETDYIGGSKFPADAHESALDELTMVAQQLQEEVNRCLKIATTITDAGVVDMAFNAAARANKYLGFDASGDLVVDVDLGNWRGTWATATFYTVGDTIIDGGNGADTGNLYRCVSSHTSGTWATDLGNSLWDLMVDVDTLLTDCEAAQTAAEAAQAAAETAETNAALSEENAKMSENSADSADEGASEWAEKAEDSYAYGRNMVKNPDFVRDEFWSKGTGWTIGSGVASGAATTDAITQDIGVSAGNTYRVTFTVSNYSSGSVRPAIGTTGIGTARTANGQYIEDITYAGTGSLVSFKGVTAFTGDIDLISVELRGYSALHHKEKAIDAQTAAETAQTAAETAQTAAETAQTAAETAETNAETAETGAQTAEANAQAWAQGKFGIPDTDHTADGFIVDLTAGTALAFGDFCYVGSDGKMEKIDADAEATMPCTHVALETIAENSEGEFLSEGFLRDDTWAWTPGTLLFASATAGDITATAPSGTGDIIQVVAIAVSADVIYFKPDYAYAELS